MGANIKETKTSFLRKRILPITAATSGLILAAGIGAYAIADRGSDESGENAPAVENSEWLNFESPGQRYSINYPPNWGILGTYNSNIDVYYDIFTPDLPQMNQDSISFTISSKPTRGLSLEEDTSFFMEFLRDRKATDGNLYFMSIQEPKKLRTGSIEAWVIESVDHEGNNYTAFLFNGAGRLFLGELSSTASYYDLNLEIVETMLGTINITD